MDYILPKNAASIKPRAVQVVGRAVGLGADYLNGRASRSRNQRGLVHPDRFEAFEIASRPN